MRSCFRGVYTGPTGVAEGLVVERLDILPPTEIHEGGIVRYDYSSVAERRLILSEPSYLRLSFRSPHWRIYKVLGSKPLVAPLGEAAAEAISVGRQGFSLDVRRPGEFLVRVNFTPYWSISRGAGCIIRHGDWTVARAAHPGVFRVAADFTLGNAWNAMTGARKTC